MLLLLVTELGNGTESNAVVVAGRTSSCDVMVPIAGCNKGGGGELKGFVVFTAEAWSMEGYFSV